MKLIESFSIDHTKIIAGIYVSRTDKIGKEIVTTYDVRLKKPNREPAIDVAAMHSLEHIIATAVRNDKKWKNEVVYFGPMGCLTGFYLILKGNKAPQEIYGLILSAFKSVEKQKTVAGATAVSCGNYSMHNLPMAKYYAKEFVEYLIKNKDNPLIFEYPKSERPKTDKGQTFFDS